jgi:glycosyltransferase involved in cell wall biosynthesis
MKKIALIVQRYGLEVNGGAEFHCRILAEKLNPLYDIEVLTSCATDYISWANEYSEGIQDVNGVKIRRFPVEIERDKVKAHFYGRKLRKRSLVQKVLRFLRILDAVERILRIKSDTEADMAAWSSSQGPYTPGLITYLEAHYQEYDALIFFTYLYFPTLYGLRVAPEKSILIPTAHDEPPIYMPGFKAFFKLPKAILYNTQAEKNFVNEVFNNSDIYSAVVGVGIDTYVPKTTISAREILNSESPYLIYIGRIDAAKGCEMMFNHFLKYKKATRNDVKLVLVGKAFMDIPQSNDIIAMGFINDEMKHSLLVGASALIIPSFYESLSLVTLESMAEGIPVIANEKCEVLKDHINTSHAGFIFGNYTSFKLAIDSIFDYSTDKDLMKSNAKKYVSDNYRWSSVLDKFGKVIDYITNDKHV